MDRRVSEADSRADGAGRTAVHPVRSARGRLTLDVSNYPQLLTALLPELVLSAWALILLLVVAWRHGTARDLRLAGWLTLVALATAAGAAWWLWWQSAHAAGISTMIAVDDFRFVADWIFLGGALLTVLFSMRYLEREGLLAPEYYVLLVFATIGMMLMGGGEDLMVIFLGLELMSICLYALAGFNRRSPRAAEAGLKYFLLGAFASAFLLYGIALVYGATGTTNLSLIGVQVVSLELQHAPLLLLGVALLLIGFGFKVAAVPFHMWAPDVYDGSPTPVAGYMATAVKAAAFAALFRVVGEAFGPVGAWREIVAGLAITTMVAGNLIALAQRSLKRMLAYSSVAHAGYLLVAVATGVAAGSAAFVFYLVAYSLTTLAAFALLAAKGRGGESDVQIDDLAGLAAQRPWLAFALSVCMLSLLGFPGTAGFIGKWYILVAAMSTGQGWLAALLVLTSVVSAGYYLPVVMAMYMQPAVSTEAHAEVCLDGFGRVAMAVAVAGLLFFGVAPNRLLDLSKTSATVQRGAAAGAIAAPTFSPGH
ncbi:MAG: NADH-quinone oxidoreductase subunit N [Gemmatimonadetes bacterium]|nr:MAG: NADH-quinone oxidoreductase subunit N [Gemmatimonadota bacterium]